MSFSPNSYTARALRSDPQIDFGLFGAAYMTGGTGFNDSLSRLAANASGNPWSSGSPFGTSFMMGGFGTFRSPFANPFGGFAGIGLGRFSPTTQEYLRGYFNRRPQLPLMGGFASMPQRAPASGPPSSSGPANQTNMNVDASTPPPARKHARPLSSASGAAAPTTTTLSTKDRDDIIKKLMDNGYSKPEAEGIVAAAVTAAKNDGIKARSLISSGLPKKDIEDPTTGSVDPAKRKAWLEAFGKWYGTKIAGFESDDAKQYADFTAFTHNDSWIELGDDVDVIRDGGKLYEAIDVAGWEGTPAQTVANTAGSQLFYRQNQWYSKDAAGAYQPVTVASALPEGNRLVVSRTPPVLRDDLDDTTAYLSELDHGTADFRVGIESAVKRKKVANEKRIAAVAEGVTEMVPHLEAKGEISGSTPTLTLTVSTAHAASVSTSLASLGATPADLAAFNGLFTELPPGTTVTFNGERLHGTASGAYTALTTRVGLATPKGVTIPEIDVSGIHGADAARRVQERIEKEIYARVKLETTSPIRITIERVKLPASTFHDPDWEKIRDAVIKNVRAKYSTDPAAATPLDVTFTNIDNLALVAPEQATRLAELLPSDVRSKVAFEYIPDGDPPKLLKMTVSPADADAVAAALAAVDEAQLNATLGAFPPLTLIQINSYPPATIGSYIDHRDKLVELVRHDAPGPATIEHLDLTGVTRATDEPRGDYVARLAQEFVDVADQEAQGKRNNVTALDVKSVELPKDQVDAKAWEEAWKKAKDLYATRGLKVNIGPAQNLTATMPLTAAERAEAKAIEDADQKRNQEFMTTRQALFNEHTQFVADAGKSGATRDALQARYDVMEQHREEFIRRCSSRFKDEEGAKAAAMLFSNGDIAHQVETAWGKLPTSIELARTRAAAEAAATAAVTPPPAAVKPMKVGVLGIESTEDTPAMNAVADDVTQKLRGEFRDAGHTLSADRDFIEMKLVFCEGTAAPECMAKAGKSLGVDKLVYGTLTRDASGKPQLTITHLDVASQKTEQSTTILPPVASSSPTADDKRAAAVREAVRDAIGKDIGGSLPTSSAAELKQALDGAVTTSPSSARTTIGHPASETGKLAPMTITELKISAQSVETDAKTEERIASTDAVPSAPGKDGFMKGVVQQMFTEERRMAMGKLGEKQGVTGAIIQWVIKVQRKKGNASKGVATLDFNRVKGSYYSGAKMNSTAADDVKKLFPSHIEVDLPPQFDEYRTASAGGVKIVMEVLPIRFQMAIPKIEYTTLSEP